MFRSFPYYRQRDANDCGPSCLQMIARYYGIPTHINGLREITGINKDGVSLLGIADAAKDIGLQSVALRTSADELEKIQLPAILHWKQRHFVVLYKIKGEKYFVADPAIGKLKFSKNEFLQNWKGDEEKGILLALEATSDRRTSDKKETRHKRQGGKFRIIEYLKPYKGKLALLALCLLAGSVFQFIFPFLTQGIVDRGIKQRNLSIIKLLLLGQFILFFAQALTDFLRARILLFISTHVNLTILSSFWAKLMRLPLHFFETKKTGDILQRINDHKRIELFITGSALNSIFSLFNILVFSVVLFSFNSKIFGVFAIGSILYFAWIRIFLAKRRKLDYERFAAAAKESSATMQYILGMQEIKLNNAEKLKKREWQVLQKNLFRFNFKSLSLNQYQQAGAFFINQGKNILITYLVAIAVLAGTLTLGQMLAIQFIIGQLNSPVEQLIQFVQQAQEARISFERLDEIHQLPDEASLGSSNGNSPNRHQSIITRDLSFRYPGAEFNALENINLEIPANKVTAIVGMSGSGKTTLLKLLLKFYDDYRGSLKVGRTELRDVKPSAWRAISGSVLQESFIFNDSIAKNIALASEKPDKIKLRKACKIAAIDAFIDDLPNGYQTKIGAEGNGISAGQRQRILVARAIYKDPEFLFFDEATNALDANNEKLIMENLQEFFHGRTVVIAAHRLSTVIKADKIVVIENGKIIDEGTHEYLSKKNGRYFELIRNQLAGI